MAASTRPLTLGEILDHTVQLYRRNFLLLTGIAAPAAAVLVLVSGSLGVVLTSRFFNLAQTTQPGGTPPSPQVFSQEALIVVLLFAVFFVIGVPLLLGAFSMTLAALNYAAARIERGEPATVRASYAYAFRHFWRHVGILFLQALLAWVVPYFAFGFLIVVGAVVAALTARSGARGTVEPLLIVGLILVLGLMVAACVLIWLRLSLAYPVSIAEDGKAWPSLKRSNQLTAGTRGRIFLMFLLVFILTMVVSSALTFPLDLIIFWSNGKSGFPANPVGPVFTLMQIANLGVSFLVRIFVMPIYSVALVLFYIDQRTRNEGYDIEQLMLRAGWTELPQPSIYPSMPPPAPTFAAPDLVAYTPTLASGGPEPAAVPPAFLPEPPSPAQPEPPSAETFSPRLEERDA